jgi:hypothetical protein
VAGERHTYGSSVPPSSGPPLRPARESEGQWLRAALKAAEAHVDFTRYLPDGSRKAPHNHAYEYFYEQLRVSIFHAKGSRSPRLPHEVDGMADLAELTSG